MDNKKVPLAVHSNQRQIGDGYHTSSYVKQHNTSARQSQPIRTPAGRVVGEVRDGTFYKKVKGSKHLLRQPRGWANDIDILDQLDHLGVRWICLTDTETNKRYRANVQDFWRHGVELNRGFGPQRVLPLTFWQVSQPGQPQVVQLAFEGMAV